MMNSHPLVVPLNGTAEILRPACCIGGKVNRQAYFLVGCTAVRVHVG